MEVSYEKAVLYMYQSRKKVKKLSPNLVDPTSANLKSECRLVANRRYDKSDERTLTAFFGEARDKIACLRAIDKCPSGKFKTLSNYLRGETASTNIKNTELLAWLIDFEPRPFELSGKYFFPDEPLVETADGENVVHITRSSKTRKQFIAAIVLVLMTVVVVWVWMKNTPGVVFAGHAGCMYWAGDRYRPISCDKTAGSAIVLPLDSWKMAHFRKITRPDTITENALGSIWYVKYHGVYECYTGPGSHPVDTSLKLKVLIDYVLLRYIHPGLHATQELPSQ